MKCKNSWEYRTHNKCRIFKRGTLMYIKEKDIRFVDLSTTQNFNDLEEPLESTGTDGRPNGMGNLVEAKMESTQQFAEGRNAHNTSNFATMMHLLKGNIGPGILAMPNAVKNAGLLVGAIGIPILGLLCVHCMHLLVISSKTIAARLGCTSLDYPTTAEKAFALGPARIRRFASFTRFAVSAMLVLTQFGFCCVYFLFVSKSIHDVVIGLNGSSPMSFIQIMSVLLPFMVILNFVPDLEKLSPVSLCANILQSIGLVIVLCYVIPAPHSTALNVYSVSIDKFPLYFGTAMYAFEGIGVILYIENSMANPESFGGLTGVLNTGMVIVTALFTAVGTYGYLKYGDFVKSSITFNLPAGIVSEIVRLMFALAIFLTYPLQFQVPLTMIWPFMKEKLDLGRFTNRKQLIMELSLRAFLVSVTFVLAFVIPMLNLFIALVGALASSSLALIFPSLIDIATVWESDISQKKLAVVLLKDIFIIIVGLSGNIIGTYTAINDITHCFKTPNDLSCQV